MNKVKNAALKRAQEFGWDEECIPTSIDQEIEGSNLGEDEVKLMWGVFDALCEGTTSDRKELVKRFNKEIDYFWDTVGSALPEHKDSPYSLKNE